MIVLELLYLLVFIGFLGAAFALICFKQTPKKPAYQAQTQSSTFVPSKSSRDSSQLINIQPQQSRETSQGLREKGDPIPSRYSVLEKEKSPDQVIKVGIDSCENGDREMEEVKTMVPSMKKESQLTKDLGEIAQINSLLEANSQVISEQEISECYTRRDKESRKIRGKKRLEAVKNHYKTIIEELKNKLEEVCIRNNESLSLPNPNETISFSQEDSLAIYQQDQNQYFLEAKVEEIQNLKDELQFHEEMVTALLEEDKELKDKLKVLEEENQLLKKSNSMIPLESKLLEQEGTGTIGEEKQQEKSQQTEGFLNKSHCVAITKQEDEEENNLYLPRSERSYKQEQSKSNAASHKDRASPIKNLYASQLFFPAQEHMPLFSSRGVDNPAALSTISLMSIVEGAISIGLLGECRFLNEISKKFTINEVKKALKRRIGDSELLYSSVQNSQEEKKFSTIVMGKGNLLFLIKLASGKNLACFVEQPITDFLNQQQGCLLLLDLTKRKTVACCQGSCLRNQHSLLWGNNELVINDETPASIICQEFGLFISEQAKALELLGSQNLKAEILTIEIFELYPQSEA